jgi:hypothetical protein
MLLINTTDTFEVKAKSAKGVTFTCSPIIARDMAKFNDMSMVLIGGDNVQTQFHTRNYQIFAKYVQNVDGITNEKGAKLVWKPEMIDGMPITVVNEVANQIMEKSKVSEKQRGN